MPTSILIFPRPATCSLITGCCQILPTNRGWHSIGIAGGVGRGIDNPTIQREEETSMKRLSFAVALLSFFGLALLGCSDESSTPVAPADQTVQAPVTLEKCNRTDFTFSHNPIPPYIIDPGDVKLVRGK
jgi:hypothetical protein